MPVIDQHSDPAFGVLYQQAARMPAFAEFVKEASIDEPPQVDTAYAWPEARRYRIDDEKQAALSYAYAMASTGVPGHVVTRIKEALDVYGVDMAIFDQQKVAAAEPDPSTYLLPNLRLFPVKTAADVEHASRALVDNLSRLDLEHRATACVNLVEKAAAFNVSLPLPVMQLAGVVVSSTKVARDLIEARAYAAKDDTLKVAYQKLADGLREQPAESTDRDSLVKLASALAVLDEKAGLVRHYDRKLPDAVRSVFNTEKVAYQMVDVNGTLVSVDKLASLPVSFWEDLAGPEFVREVAPSGSIDRKKIAEVVDTLPLDLKIILRSQLRC